jgi:hypothetical protein
VAQGALKNPSAMDVFVAARSLPEGNC